MTRTDQTQFVSGTIDLTAWGIADDIGAELGKRYMREISETIAEEFKKEPPSVCFPWMWAPDGDGIRGKAVSDPVTLYIDIPLGANEDDQITFSISLENVVDDYIDAIVNGSDPTDKICEHENVENTKALAGRLRELADKLERRCANEAEQEQFFRDNPDLYDTC